MYCIDEIQYIFVVYFVTFYKLITYKKLWKQNVKQYS